ncbi:MAG: hypothetical protein PHN84_04280 [Desulfuromonadaceae bacterium]|nr:hypothetical protein [Desulfuromonadaceae bacterium]MDD2856285.1 hypothetical protein [Desulfuromonadaceae bacterium]
MYSEYVKLLDKTKYKPKLVIIPINLRSFTGSSIRRPALNFPLRQIYIRYRSKGVFEWADYLKFRFLGYEDTLTDYWKDQQVIYDGKELGTHRSIQEQSRIPESFDYNPERETLYAKQLGIKFRYHYMAVLAEDDAMFGYISDTINVLNKMKIPVLCYITPVNYIDGKKYVGDDFVRRIDKNLATVQYFMKKRQINIINLSKQLQPSEFIDKRDVYEHYTFVGRSLIAESLAKAVATLP